MIRRRYGKSSDHLFSIKQDFFTNNEALLARSEELAELYTRQPLREYCKNCASPLRGDSFVKHGVKYIVCDVDGHLNGAFEDSEEYARAVYTDEGGAQYAQVYREEDRVAYQKRVDSIYTPKVDFLTESLRAESEDPSRLTFAELGAGSGFLLAALEKSGIHDVHGYDVSQVQADLAEQMLGRPAITVHELDDVKQLAASLQVDVLMLIGTLEHLQEPRELLARIASNDSVRYLFLQLPLFSVSVLLEAAFQEAWPRQLSGGHTHLYTEESIEHFCNEFGFKRLSEWWFGTDMMDLYRQVFIYLNRSPDTSDLIPRWQDSLRPAVDPMQLVLDERRLSSQVHIVLGKS